MPGSEATPWHRVVLPVLRAKPGLPGPHDSGHILAHMASSEALDLVRILGGNQEAVIWHGMLTTRTMFRRPRRRP
jgi:hypothetical protein